MKNILFLFFPAILCSCQTNNIKISSEPIDITRKIISFKQDKMVSILIADNMDIIEIFKPTNNNTCTKIELGKKYSFKVTSVSGLIQQGGDSPKIYILNDSIIIKYNHYYTAEEDQNICIK
ncbi:hypothetical protein LF887_10800 [Chryseobacterium sp. MEBOG06]|uniref:hypothetical protein n=1 Tax=unclassified Chryseobacterium TaxID=2593645 RepID=UPI001F429A42|nr:MULTISPECIES: hypothetical protein [unclassified Chryseobacterium]UKB86085.1 hypothetical protein LF887_10800 [Chryseobacterium sp. MEBOG06]